MRVSLMMAKNFLKIFTRDRQAIFFIFIFPTILIIAFGISSTREPALLDIGVTNYSTGVVGENIIEKLNSNSAFNVIEGDEETLMTAMTAMTEKRLDVLIVLPSNFLDNQKPTNKIIVKVDSSQRDRMGLALSALRQTMTEVEREQRGVEPMFELAVEDIQMHSVRYIDFVLPGLIAMMLMNISLSGSGSNIVEYRRKGILKRLFVTPIRPSQFITGVVLARASLSLFSLLLSTAIAVYLFDVKILGNLLLMFFIVLIGLAIFLCIGFTLGSWAKTQQSIQSLVSLVTFPQILLSGIFFPIDSWPSFIQPLANLLPLTFVASALRDIVTNGLGLLDLLPALTGMLIWLILSFTLSTRCFVWKEVAN